MIILAIETSCDDTCVSIVNIKRLPRTETKFLVRGQMSNVKNARFEILSNIVSSQVKLHAKYGGVWPFLAKREHQKNLPVVFEKALKGAKLLLEKIDLIVVTVGPGLEPCLWVGVNFAKDLAKSLNLPIIPVNHIEAHIFANFLSLPILYDREKWEGGIFPAICLIVSGGHTQLILMRDLGKYKILGETRDDAAGECFDKTARILGLGYPGGPAIAAEAAKFIVHRSSFIVHRSSFNVHNLPRPMIYQKNYDFSFSGLKTAVLYLVKQLTINNQQLTIKQKREISVEMQQAVIDVLIKKTIRAAKEYKAKSIILGGGVAANKELRNQFQLTISNQQLTIKFFVPPKNFCTDNAAMVAVAAYYNWLEGKTSDWRDIKAEANLRLDML